MRRLLVPTLLAFAALAVPAQGATVTSSATTFHDPGGKGFPEVWITTRHIDVVAVPGEANQLVVSQVDGAVIVNDAGAPLGAGAGCAAVGDGSVACGVSDAQQLALSARLGDGHDRLEVTAAGMRVEADGGPGGDRIGASGGGELDGGDGDDVLTLGNRGTLRGGPGADTLTGSPSYDTLDGGPGTDVLDGGAGRDVVSYEGRADGVVIELGAPTAGAPGEADSVAGFEAAVGGDGADVLGIAPGAPAATADSSGADREGVTLTGGAGDDLITGGGRDDALTGGEGADRITGAGGDDTLEAGAGDDVLDGGDGRDHIVARDGADLAHGGRGADEIADLAEDAGAGDVFHGDEGNDDLYGTTVFGDAGNDELYGAVLRGGPGDDRLQGPRTPAAGRAVDCGPGRDTLMRPADRVLVPRGCERVEPWFFGGRTVRVPPLVDGRRVTVWMPNGCLYASVGTRCRVKAALFVNGRHAGTEQVRWRRERQGARALRWTLRRRPRAGAVLWLRLVKYETDETTERGGYSVRIR